MQESLLKKEAKMLEWYEELGFDSDPFAKELGTVGNEDEIKEMFYSIMAGNMLFVEGKDGSGKTNLLKEVLKKFGGRKKIIYVNCKSIGNGLNVERLLKNRYGLMGWLLNMKPRNMILLLDEIEHLSEKNCERIKYYYDMNYLRSVIFTSEAMENAGLNKSISQRISKVLKLNPISDYEAVKVVRDAIGKNFLPDRLIKKMYGHSGRNIGKMLENCKAVLKEMAKLKKNELGEEELDGIMERLK